MRIVNPEDVAVLKPSSEPELTMITCYPFEFFGHAPKRFVVQATLFSPREL
jgi:sortase A